MLMMGNTFYPISDVAKALFSIVVLQSSNFVTSVLSVIGGLLTVVIIYALARKHSFSNGRLIIIGLGMQSILNTIVSWLLLVSSENTYHLLYDGSMEV